jgi:hypothetical protein
MVAVSSSEPGVTLPAANPAKLSVGPACSLAGCLAGCLARRGSRVVAVAMAGLSLASCSSVSMPGFDAFKPKPTTTLLLIESSPAGAEAKTSLGQSCRTPCTVQIGAANDFTVAFTLDGYKPQTLNVHATMSPGGFSTAPSPVFDPPSLFPTLEPVRPPAIVRKPPKPRA